MAWHDERNNFSLPHTRIATSEWRQRRWVVKRHCTQMRTCAEHGRTRLARERPKSVAQFLISTKTGGRKKSTRFSHNLVRSCSYLAFAKIGKRRAVAECECSKGAL